MKYIESSSTNPCFNLALEEFVFNSLPKGESCFMLWQNKNAIVVGKHQNTIEEINQKYVRDHDITVVRRLSGGGAVYHDMGNLNFTFIVDQEDIEDFNFQVFVLPVINALSHYGIKAEFTGRNDITIDGKKISGNSQYIRHGRVLHHGCIMLDSNTAAVASALNVKAAKFISKSSKSVKSRVTTINANAPVPLTMSEFKEALRNEIFGNNEIEYYNLSEDDLKSVNKLQAEKYETWDWNYGYVKEYSMEREEKFDRGFVTCKLTCDKGIIRDIRFFGDFFGSNDISELEKALIGCHLDNSLEKKLKEINVGRYMNNITAKEIAGLILG
ncbi:MAG: lipoate--protein ligase [Emergencia sp.]